MNLIEKVLENLIGKTCSSKFINFEITSDCFKLFVSKALGLGIVAGSAILKLPQIIKIIQTNSTKGISLTSYLLELTTVMISTCYNIRLSNPFSTFGESVFINIQNLIIISFLFVIGKNTNLFGLFVTISCFLGCLFVLLTPSITSLNFILTVQWFGLFLVVLINKRELLQSYHKSLKSFRQIQQKE